MNSLNIGDRIYAVFGDCFPKAQSGWPVPEDYADDYKFWEAMTGYFHACVAKEGSHALRLPPKRTRAQMLQALLFLYGKHNWVYYKGDETAYYEVLFSKPPPKAWVADALGLLL